MAAGAALAVALVIVACWAAAMSALDRSRERREAQAMRDHWIGRGAPP